MMYIDSRNCLLLFFFKLSYSPFDYLNISQPGNLVVFLTYAKMNWKIPLELFTIVSLLSPSWNSVSCIQ